MSKRAIILSNGEIQDFALLRKRLVGWEEALVIAADNGAAFAEPLGLELDVLIGDMDSLDAAFEVSLPDQDIRSIKTSAEKDETDLELALLYAVDQGVEHIAVLGGIGGRLDMTLSNTLLLTHPRLIEEEIRVELWWGEQTAWLIQPPGESVSGRSGDTLSLIPLGGDVRGITTQHLKYPLDNETLRFGPARGISNVLQTASADIKTGNGVLLAIHSPGKPD